MSPPPHVPMRLSRLPWSPRGLRRARSRYPPGISSALSLMMSKLTCRQTFDLVNILDNMFTADSLSWPDCARPYIRTISRSTGRDSHASEVVQTGVIGTTKIGHGRSLMTTICTCAEVSDSSRRPFDAASADLEKMRSAQLAPIAKRRKNRMRNTYHGRRILQYLSYEPDRQPQKNTGR